MLKKILLSLGIVSAAGMSFNAIVSAADANISTDNSSNATGYTLTYNVDKDNKETFKINKDVSFTADQLFYISGDINNIATLKTIIEDKWIQSTYVCIKNQDIVGSDFADYKKNVENTLKTKPDDVIKNNCDKEFVAIVSSADKNSIDIKKDDTIITATSTNPTKTDIIKGSQILDTDWNVVVNFKVQKDNSTAGPVIPAEPKIVKPAEPVIPAEPKAINTKETWLSSVVIWAMAMLLILLSFKAFSIIKEDE